MTRQVRQSFLLEALRSTAPPWLLLGLGTGQVTKSMYAKAAWLILRYRMSMDEAVVLYNKYVGDWGGTSTSYRFEAIDCDKDGKNEVVVKTLTKQPMTQVVMTAKADHGRALPRSIFDYFQRPFQAVPRI